MVPTMLCGLPASSRFACATAPSRNSARMRVDEMTSPSSSMSSQETDSHPVVERPTPQILNRAACMGAKAEIRAGKDSARIRGTPEKVEEFRRWHREQLRTRDEVQHPALGLRGNHRKTLVVREQLAKRGVIGTEYLVGIAIEGYGDKGQLKLAGSFRALARKSLDGRCACHRKRQ